MGCLGGLLIIEIGHGEQWYHLLLSAEDVKMYGDMYIQKDFSCMP
jgi:hypothetical protein